jgi:Arc/MetJ-type ribon-helix-helix transcriptional regulator
LPKSLAKAIDQWAKANAFRGRSAAIRRLVELGLAAPQPTLRPSSSPKVASKASELAAQQIDQMSDASVTHEERQTRKRRLLKGPKEFRDFRGDLPERKK